MIRPRRAGEARKLLRRILPRRERADLINAAEKGPVREPPQVELGIYCEEPRVNYSGFQIDVANLRKSQMVRTFGHFRRQKSRDLPFSLE